MSEELKPCPFCGQQDAFVEQLDSDASVVICQGMVDENSACLSRGPVGVQQSDMEDQPGREAAIAEWNLRAQPAEAEGVVTKIECTTCRGTGSLEFEGGAVVKACAPCKGTGRDLKAERYALAARLAESIAALAAVTAERDRLQEQRELNDMVHGTKGRERVAALLAKNEVLSKDAARLDWLDGYIVIAEHEDTGKFAFNSIKGALRECVDAAMAAKEA